MNCTDSGAGTIGKFLAVSRNTKNGLNRRLPKKKKSFQGNDGGFLLAHELAHRADHLIYGASMNQAWQDAIKQSEEALKGHETEIKDWFELGVEYAYDAFLSDIISALSMD